MKRVMCLLMLLLFPVVGLAKITDDNGDAEGHIATRIYKLANIKDVDYSRPEYTCIVEKGDEHIDPKYYVKISVAKEQKIGKHVLRVRNKHGDGVKIGDRYLDIVSKLYVKNRAKGKINMKMKSAVFNLRYSFVAEYDGSQLNEGQFSITSPRLHYDDGNLKRSYPLSCERVKESKLNTNTPVSRVELGEGLSVLPEYSKFILGAYIRWGDIPGLKSFYNSGLTSCLKEADGVTCKDVADDDLVSEIIKRSEVDDRKVFYETLEKLGYNGRCLLENDEESLIKNPAVAQVISSEEDASYRRCLSDEFALILSDPASEVSALVCENKEIGKIKNLGCFSGLKKLNLSRNYLGGIDLSANTALTELDLSVNFLEGIDLSANTALEELDLSINFLEDVPKGLSNIESKYAYIDLLGNKFNGKAKEELRALKKKYEIVFW